MYSIPENRSSIDFSTDYSIDELLRILKDFENDDVGYFYNVEKNDSSTKRLFSKRNVDQDLISYFLVSWSVDSKNIISLNVSAWIEIKPPSFKTKVPMNLKGYMKYLPRKQALNDFKHLVALLKGDSNQIQHHSSESGKFYRHLVAGFMIRWSIWDFINFKRKFTFICYFS